MARRFNAGVAATLVVCTLIACSFDARAGDDHDDNNFRPDVIECEDALSRLEHCCPDFDAKPVLCNFSYDKTTGCGTTSTESVKPAFNTSESACIRDMSCDDLVTRKVCARAQLARAYTKTTTTNANSSSSSSGYSYSQQSPRPNVVTESHAPVCP